MGYARDIGWVEIEHSPVRVNATQFSIGEDTAGIVAQILAAGRQIRVRVAGTDAWTDTLAVQVFATGGALGRATITVFGLYDLPGAGVEALEIEWLEDIAGVEPATLHVYGARAVTRTVPTGWTIVFHTATITELILAAAVGAVAYLEGTGTIGTLTAGIGAHFALGANITGTAVVGVTRRGRTWYLPSGAAVATYAPADGSVVPVLEGDKLDPHPDDATGSELTCIDVSGTKYWVGELLPFVLQMSATRSSSINYNHSVSMPSWATAIYFDTVEITVNPAATQDATDRWQFSLTYAGTQQFSYDLNTLGVATGTSTHLRKKINSVQAIKADMSTSQVTNFTLSKLNSPGNLTVYGPTYSVRPIIS